MEKWAYTFPIQDLEFFGWSWFEFMGRIMTGFADACIERYGVPKEPFMMRCEATPDGLFGSIARVTLWFQQ